ncbi:4-carboxy-4-hydroxy-2-oxoadipate aldolase/oxaloacetate decarboxylase [Thermodesulforhabdus norvegica]|uniref:4-hydroxy-4-methyl-2-oxoglutarate aldolase n=1 Tax=Thermodesulforhabdus norvegica TaxID=39841 RepID=A0A1I4VWR4_9BACT|nr:4-carboxy-4-hydroxy-2-oxoadipate aldolase/oxaloacetate decarboxylase [Thermodesulforhabdus norvegica]SFN05701.1 4-hydroxy-4-methyl-2-oxoglutarate aldolase [Thermodesulforhabdus norvegica]
MVHVIKKIQRPPEEIIDKFRTLGSATVYEASGRSGSVHPSIKPLRPGMKIVGPAVTVKCAPGDNLMLHKALEVAEPGDVIVASTGNYPFAGYFGDLMATYAVSRGIAGLAIDGCVRDSSSIAEMGLAVFCRGTCIRGTTKGLLGLINHPILFGEVIVSPGDLVLGDDDGIVIVERDRIEEVLEASLNRARKEEEKARVLSSGVSTVSYNRLDRVFAQLGLVEESS